MLIVPMLCILGGMTYYTYHEIRNTLDAQITQTAGYIVESNSNIIYSSLKEKEVLVSTVAQVLGEKAVTQPAEVDFLRQVKNAWPGIKSVYTGYENKTCADSQGVTEKEKPQGYDPRTRDWYKVALATDEIGYTEIYESTNKQLSAGVVKKISRDGKVLGVAGIGIDIQLVHDLAEQFKMGKTGYAIILDAKGNFIYHPRYGLQDNVFQVENGALAEYGKNLMSGTATIQTGAVGGVEMLMASSPIGKTGWTFIVFVPKSEMLKQANVLGAHSLISSLAGLGLLAIIILITTLKIVQRIKKVEAMADRVANGDLTMETDRMLGFESGDEIDKLMDSFLHMKENLRGIISHVYMSSNKVATSAEHFSGNSRQSAEASCSVASSVASITQGSEEQVNALHEVTAIIEEMSASIEEVAATTQGMSLVADTATNVTTVGQQAIDKAINQMECVVGAARTAKETSNKLENSSKQIGEIVELISNIAGQTNLLALNAAIEAARAGEQGRGFAVVAEEVRKLAEQSEQAARQITTLIQSNYDGIKNVVESIENAISNVDHGVHVVSSAGEEFNKITRFVNEVVSQVNVISKSLEQLTQGSEKIVVSVNGVEIKCRDASGELHNVSAAVQEQSAVMEEIAATSNTLSNLADELQGQVQKFKL